jgi:ADP-heptose:LPS heptosyltransferase
LPEEHREFEREFGKVEHLPTQDLLQVARLIAGSDLFIGNQGCPAWIAMAIGHKLIQETNDNEFSSVIERPNACFDMDKARIDELLQ